VINNIFEENNLGIWIQDVGNEPEEDFTISFYSKGTIKY
jgi:hypothetical protein